MVHNEKHSEHVVVSSDERIKKQTIALAVIGLAVVLVAVGIWGTWQYFNDRALPNTVLGSINVGGKTRDEIKKIAQEQVAKISLSFEQGDKKIDAKPEELGIKFDIDQTVQNALDSGRTLNELSKPWQNRELALSYTSDFGEAINFAKQNFPEVVTDAKDAELVYNND